MTIFKKIVITVLFLLSVVFISAFIFISINGKRLVETHLKEIFHRPVVIGSVYVSFPLTIHIKDLSVDDYFRVSSIAAAIDPFHFADKDVRLRKLILTEPFIVIKKGESGIVLGSPSDQKDNAATKIEPQENIVREDFSGLAIDQLLIREGKFNFVDTPSDPEGFSIALKDINLKASRVSFGPRATTTKFHFKAYVQNPHASSSAGTIKGGGWVNWHKKDMDATLEVSNLDGKTFSHYYKDSFSKDVKSIFIDATTRLISKNNEMNVKCQLKIRDLVFEPAGEKDSKSFSFEDMLLSGMQSQNNEMTLNLNFKTKMDSFKIDSIPFSGSVRQQDVKEKGTAD
ncbi:MAG: DUF748 domain-containing protein [Candidatus Omnitrophota bacterium]